MNKNQECNTQNIILHIIKDCSTTEKFHAFFEAFPEWSGKVTICDYYNIRVTGSKKYNLKHFVPSKADDFKSLLRDGIDFGFIKYFDNAEKPLKLIKYINLLISDGYLCLASEFLGELTALKPELIEIAKKIQNNLDFYDLINYNVSDDDIKDLISLIKYLKKFKNKEQNTMFMAALLQL